MPVQHVVLAAAGCCPGRDIARFVALGHVVCGIDLNPVFVAKAPNGNPTQYQYNLNHQVTQVTDAATHVTKTGHDLDGLVTSTTDANGNTTYYTLDADGQITQQQAPAQPVGTAETCPATSTPPATYCNVTQYVYDQVGNRTQVLTPRATAAGYSLSSSCVTTPKTSPCPYTWRPGHAGRTSRPPAPPHQ